MSSITKRIENIEENLKKQICIVFCCCSSKICCWFCLEALTFWSLSGAIGDDIVDLCGCGSDQRLLLSSHSGHNRFHRF